MAHGEIFLQLAVNYADDPKVRALARYGRDARRIRDLYVQMACYCKENLSDGVVPADQIGILVYPDPPAIGRKDAVRLAEVGLIEQRGDGWFVPGFLKRNKSRQAIRDKAAAKAAGAAKANHVRWHVERGESKPDCEWCQQESQNGSQNGSESDHNTDPSITPNGIHRDRDRDRDIGHRSESVPADPQADPPPPSPPDREPATTGEDQKAEGEDQPADNGPLDALITEVKRIRPEWSIRSIHRALTRPAVAERPPAVVRSAILAVARDPGSQAPGRLEHDGPWWRLPDPPKPPPAVRDEPWHATPPLGQRDNNEVNTRGRAAVDAAMQASRRGSQ